MVGESSSRSSSELAVWTGSCSVPSARGAQEAVVVVVVVVVVDVVVVVVVGVGDEDDERVENSKVEEKQGTFHSGLDRLVLLAMSGCSGGCCCC